MFGWLHPHSQYIYHWMKTQGIGTNVCHAGCKGHVSHLRFKREQKDKNKVTLWDEMKPSGTEYNSYVRYS